MIAGDCFGGGPARQRRAHAVDPPADDLGVRLDVLGGETGPGAQVPGGREALHVDGLGSPGRRRRRPTTGGSRARAWRSPGRRARSDPAATPPGTRSPHRGLVQEPLAFGAEDVIQPGQHTLLRQHGMNLGLEPGAQGDERGRKRTSSRSSRTWGGAIHASGRSSRRGRCAISVASRSSFFTRRAPQCCSDGCTRPTRIPAACSISAAQYQPWVASSAPRGSGPASASARPSATGSLSMRTLWSLSPASSTRTIPTGDGADRYRRTVVPRVLLVSRSWYSEPKC
jgi:hypothetical protein